MDTMHYTQVEVSDQDTIEDVAERLTSHAPSSCIYHGIEIQVDAGKSVDEIVMEFRKHRRLIENKDRLRDFVYSTVEIVAIVEDGNPIDVRKLIGDARPGQLYMVHNVRADFSIGSVGIAYSIPGPRHPGDPGRLGVVANETISALGSLILEGRLRLAAAELRIEALELQLTKSQKS
jgi:hypothetical protein